jgi:hypothetical protein
MGNLFFVKQFQIHSDLVYGIRMIPGFFLTMDFIAVKVKAARAVEFSRGWSPWD